MDLGTGGTGEGKSTGSGVASMIKFGYKDYLMLFVFIAVCADKDYAVISRVGDLIQLNISFDRGDIKEDAAGQVLISHSSPIGVRASDGAMLYREIVDGVQIEVIKIGDTVTTGYPTGGINTGLLDGFSSLK